MTGKFFIIATALTAVFLISAGAYAGNGMGGGMGGGLSMGGQGHMMGNSGNDMMDSGQNFYGPRTSQPRRSTTDQYEKQQERLRLREEIRERRQELSDLYRSDKTDKALIDQKIAGLNELETAYDRSVSEAN